MTPLRRGLITVALVLGPVMQVLDSSVMSIALTSMQGTLSAAQDQIAWVLTAYLIAVAVMTPLWGAMTDRFNRKSLFLFAIAGFTVASVLSGLGDTLNEVLVYRFLQGMFGAALVPLSQAGLMDVYEPKDYGVAMSWWGVGIMFGPVFGPTIGGYITEWYSWRWVFFMNVPVGLFGFLMVGLLVPPTTARRRRPFNYFGYLMLAVALGSLQFVLDRGERLDWWASPLMVGLACISAAAFWVFLVNSFTAAHPFVDPLILANRNFLFGMLLRVVFGILLFGSLVLIPPFLQNMLGYPVADAGLMMAPRGLATMVAAIIVGRIVKYLDPRKLIAFGMSLAAISAWQMSLLTLDASMSWIVVLIMLQGAGFACFFIPLSTATFSDMAAEQRDQGTAFFALTGNIGRSAGVAVLAGFLARNTQANHARLSEHASPFNDLIAHVPLPEAWNLAETAGLAALNAEITRQASMLAYIADFQLLTAVLVFCLPLTLLMRNPRRIEAK